MKTLYIIFEFSEKNKVPSELTDPIYLCSKESSSVVFGFLYIWTGTEEDADDLVLNIEDWHNAKYITIEELLDMKGLEILLR